MGMEPPIDREERVRSILEVKEYIAKKIEEREEEIEMLRRNLELLDSALTKSSFSKASDLLRSGASSSGGGGPASASASAASAAAGGAEAPAAAKAVRTGEAKGRGASGSGAGGGGPEPIAIMSAAEGGKVLARAYVTDDAVSVVVADGVKIDPKAEQIQGSIIDKLVGRMRREDAAEEGGEAQAEAIVESDGGRLLSLTVRNYRKKERVGEIVGMARWAVNQLAAAGR